MILRLLIAGIILCCSVVPARAVWWATEWTQIMNNLELILQNYNTIKGLYNDAIMIKNQVEGLKSVASYNGNWGDLDHILLQIESIKNRNQAVFNDVQGMYNRTKAQYPELAKLNDYGRAVNSLNGPIIASADGAIQVTADQKMRMDKEQEAVRSLLQKSDEAVGETQAIQTMNQLMAQLIKQMQELRALNEWQLAQKSAEAKKQAELENKEQADLEEVFHIQPQTGTSRPSSEKDLFNDKQEEKSSYRLSEGFKL
ncbi:MAG: hypothetical protein V2A70_06690 [Candidatus Omnitrophota bacterium]